MSEIVRHGTQLARGGGIVRIVSGPKTKYPFRWITMQRETIRLEDMDTQHLFNSMKMVFNHLAAMWGAKPIWFTKEYSDYAQMALTSPEYLAFQVTVFLQELATREIPDWMVTPLSLITAQIRSRSDGISALPQRFEVSG